MISNELFYVVKMTGAGLLLTALVTNHLMTAQRASLSEFFDLNPNCSPEDVESLQSLFHSIFKKTESFRLVLLAVAASFFICRLCQELGKILVDAQEKQRADAEKIENEFREEAENFV